MADGRPVYELVLGPNACDICEGMAGIYPAPPSVPIHVKCECTVEMVDPEDQEGTTYEVRNVQWDQEHWTEEVEGRIDNCGEPAMSGELTLPDAMVEPVEEFDPGVEDAAEDAGWEKPEAQTLSGEVQLDANTEAEFSLVLTHISVIFRGELWRVHSTEDEVAGVVQDEQLVDHVGGLYEAVVGIEIGNSEVRLCETDPDGGYFEEDAESPWLEDDPREIET